MIIRSSTPLQGIWVETETEGGAGIAVVLTLLAMLLAVGLLLAVWGIPIGSYRVPDAPRVIPSTYEPPPTGTMGQ